MQQIADRNGRDAGKMIARFVQVDSELLLDFADRKIAKGHGDLPFIGRTFIGYLFLQIEDQLVVNLKP